MPLSEEFHSADKLQRKIRLAGYAKPSRATAREVLNCFDLTSLSGDETEGEVFELCDAAKHNRLHAVCVLPEKVSMAAKALANSNIVIATVLNFPHGDRRTGSGEKATSSTVAEDVAQAIAAGARQIDIVLAHEEFRAGSKNHARSLLAACRKACPEGVTMKVILETASFDDRDQLRSACRLAIQAGADCLKTSTGKHPAGGADIERTAILFAEARSSFRNVGVKISGGIKTVEQCAQYIALGRSIMGWDCIRPELFRVGGSTLLKPLLETLQYTPPNSRGIEPA